MEPANQARALRLGAMRVDCDALESIHCNEMSAQNHAFDQDAVDSAKTGENALSFLSKPTTLCPKRARGQKRHARDAF